MLKPPQPCPWFRDSGLLSGLALVVLLTGYNVAAPHDSAHQLVGVYAVVPVTAAVLIEKVSRLVLVGALTVAGALVSIQATGVEYDAAQVLRLGITLLSCVYAVWAARRRLRQTRRLVTLGAVARAAQRAIMRPDAPTTSGVDIHVQYLSAALQSQIGGDAYEAVDTPFGLRVLVADAKGKGLESVRSASTVLGSFREWAHEEPELADLLNRLNVTVTRDGALDEFVTALAANLKARRLTFALAGHPAPVLFRAGTATTLQTPPSPPLGLFARDESPTAGSIGLQPGDVLLMFSDGLSEARNEQHEFFPFENRLCDLLERQPVATLDDLIESLIDELRAFVDGHLEDDLVLVAIRLQDQPRPLHGAASSGAGDVSTDGVPPSRDIDRHSFSRARSGY